ncbi:MAG TPA: hypothetical protein VM470_01185 [Acidimicrobiia bacterium]|nr:hypothetical protein [Acidimicrobiia bacterium]
MLIAAAAALVAWAALPTPGVLYLAATLLIAHKVIRDIGAFTEESPRRVDWFSILVIAILVIWIAMAIPAGEAKPITFPCIESICVTRPVA